MRKYEAGKMNYEFKIDSSVKTSNKFDEENVMTNNVINKILADPKIFRLIIFVVPVNTSVVCACLLCLFYLNVRVFVT